MSEWSVYLVVASLLATAVLIGKPLVALTRTNTKLECAVEKLTGTMDRFELRMQQLEQDNRSSHARIWEHMELQDGEIARQGKALERHAAELAHLKGGNA